MKFFKLDASPTVQWMKQVVTGESSATDAPSDNPLTPSPVEVDDPSQRPKNNTPKDSTTPLNSQPTDSSDSDDTQTPSTQEIIMQKPKKSEQPLLTFPTPPTSNTLLKSSNGNDATARDVNGTSEALLKNTDLQWLLSLSQYMHQADELATLLDAVVTEVGQRFQVDRALVYQFQTETEGVVLAESLTAGYTPSLNETLATVAFGAKSPREAQNQVISIHDVTEASLSPHQHQIVERFQIKASLSIPIFLDQTWGLLVVQQCARSQPWSDKDLTLLYKVATELRLALQTLELRQEKLKTEEYKQELPAIIHKISNPAYVENACQTAVQEVRRVLGAERVAIYKFRLDYFGDFMYESESGGWPALVGSAWEDPYLQENKGGRFQDDEPYVADDVYSKGLTDCHLEALEYFGVKSFIVVPIKQGEKLWGLLSAFQHSGPRHWLGREITLMTEVGRQLGVTLQGADYLMRLQEQSAQSAQFTQINQLVAEIIPKIFQAQDLATVFQTANQSIRRLLKCDRVAIYQFHSDWSSELVAERTTKGTDALENANLGAIWPKTNIQATRGGPYLNRENLVVNNIHTAGLAAEQIEELADFEVQAFMVTPIFKGDELWGLLGAYQNNKPRSWAAVEISALEQIAARVGMAMQQVDYLQQIEDTSKQIARAAEQEGLITKIVDRIRQSFDLQQAFNITSREIRNFLEVDRVAIFRFLPGTKYSKGKTIAEDVRPGYVSALEVEVIDHCFSQGFAEKYRRGHVSAIADINKAGIKQCYIDVLAQFQVQSNLVVPLMRGDDLWGLFCIHQCESPREWTASDIDFAKRIAAQLDIAIQQGEYLEQVQTKSAQLSAIAEQEQLITKIVDRIRQPLSMQQAFKTTTREIRSFLKADRVAIFKFVPDTKYSRGKTIAEDVRPGYVSAMEVEVIDHCFSQGFAEKYRRGHVSVIANIYEAGIQQCYIDVLEQFQVKSNLVVPLMRGDDLWGLFCIHQCDHPREWDAREIEFAKRIAAQLDLAIQQGEYVDQLQQQSEQLTNAAEQDKKAREQLQQQVIQLLSAVRPALDGDLTVRAPVTESEVGTVGDAYNNMLGNLRQLVIQMQEASGEVTQTSQASESAIATLTEQAQGQFRALEAALAEVKVMEQTTHAVETNAQQVETAVQQANQIVLTGDTAIDRTVDEMQQIRGTVAETNKRLKRLGESSQKISKVVNLISSFTTQTQLLALNASIEATRAGEYGRGFAVVADEVRSLARQSAEAATDIEQLVQEIQANTSAVATAMEDGIQRVSSGTMVVNEARDSLNEIVEATSHISQLVTGITRATQTQTQQCQSVTQTMQDVAAIANQTSEDSINISTAFQVLLTTAQNLQVTSQRFKVN